VKATHILSLISLFWIGACSKKKEAPPPSTPPLEQAVNGLYDRPPCDKTIPEQWTASWPVPVVQDGRLLYRAFFYGKDDGPNRTSFQRDADADVLFSPDGNALECRRRPTQGRRIVSIPPRRGSADAVKEIMARGSRLYAVTDEISRLYAGGKPLDADQEKLIAEFSTLFASLSEAGQAATYRSLNPDFWSWVEKNGGVAPNPKYGTP
jgi:hypothetical protein